jgi:lipopolysaccharide transport system permease protein
MLTEIVESRELLRNLVLRDLRGRYKRSILGILWSLINPLVSLIIFATVFRYILKATPEPGSPSGLDNFALWLLCGLLPWTFFATATASGMRSVVENGGLVRKVWFPREVLVLGSTAALQVTFLMEMLILLAALLIAGNMVLPYLPVLAVVLALLYMFSTGITFMLAAAFVYFRDLAYLWTVVIQAGFYAVPVIYPIALLEGVANDVLYRLVEANPMTVFVTSIRNCLYDLRLPSLGAMAYLAVWSVAVLMVGLAVFRRLSRRFAEEI